MAEVTKAAESAAKNKKTTRTKTAGARKTATKVAKKTAVRKTSAQQARTPRVRQVTPIAPEERHRLIAESAFLKAERRGFAGGDPVRDWLEAEQEVDGSLAD